MSKTQKEWLDILGISRKWGVALFGAIITLASLGLLPDPWNERVAAVAPFITAIFVQQVKNVDLPDNPPLPQDPM